MPDDDQTEFEARPAALSKERERAIEDFGRRAGAELRSPAPSAGLAAIARRARNQRIIRSSAAALGVIAVLTIGVIAVRRGNDSEPQPPIDTSSDQSAPNPTTTTGTNDISGDYVIGRHSLTVEGVPFSFTVPASGWEPGGLLISKSAYPGQDAEAIIFWTRFAHGTQAQPCIQEIDATGIGLRVSDLAGLLASAPGIELVSGPSDVTVGGRAAKHLSLIVRENTGCDPGFFYIWKATAGGAFWQTTELGDTINVWLVDVDGTHLFIAGETHAGAGFEVEQEIQQIVASISFD